MRQDGRRKAAALTDERRRKDAGWAHRGHRHAAAKAQERTGEDGERAHKWQWINPFPDVV